MTDRARLEAVEALVAELAEALEQIILTWVNCDSPTSATANVMNNIAEEALTTTPEEALKRAGAVEAKGYAAGLEAAVEWHDLQVQKNHIRYDDPTRTCHMVSAKAIRALRKEGE